MHEASGLALKAILEITHCEEFPVLDEYEQAWELGVDAARAVLKRTQVDPGEIGFVIYAGSGEWDVPFWSPAAKVAAELGIDQAHCFEVTNFCNAAMTAVRVAVDKIALGQAVHVLVVVGDRLSKMVDYSDPDSKALFNFGDAPAAILLGSEGCEFDVVHSAMRTDPDWADYYSGEIWDNRVIMRRRGHRRGLAEAYITNFTALVNDTLSTLEMPIIDIAYFLINQGDKGMHERLLNVLGIPESKTAFNYHRFGHTGGSDPFIALRDLRDQDRLVDGDVILVASSGMGFSWGITTLRYRT
jgi:3-oxoacyl-[acyl-carrier-protein] synthase-3